jgi:small-conductance mechanosensitive channel
VTHHHTGAALLARFVLAVALALNAPSSLGGLTTNPFLKQKSAPQAEIQAPVDSQQDDSTEKIRALLEAAQNELDRVVASPRQALNAPVGIPESQLILRQALIRQLIRAYQQHLDDMTLLNKLNRQQGLPEEELVRWHLDESRATFSMLEVEALRTEVQSRLREINTLTLNISGIDSQIQFAIDSAKRTEEEARQLLEKIEKHSGQIKKLMWERDFYLERSKISSVSLDSLRTKRQLREEELSQAHTKLNYLQSQLKKTSGKLEFSEADRDALVGELDIRLKALDKELEIALSESARARKSLALAVTNLTKAHTHFVAEINAGQRFPQQVQLENLVEIENMRLVTANARINVDRLLLSSVDAQRSVWGTWYDIVRTQDSDTERQLNKMLKGARDTITSLNHSADASFTYTLQQLGDVERSILASPDSENASFLRMKAATLKERSGFQAQLLNELISAKDLLDRWSTEFVSDASRTNSDLSLLEWKRQAKMFASAIWSFELFSAEDTIEIGGRKLTTERSITLGKVISALLMLVIGLLVGRVLINAFCRLSVRYLKTSENETMLAGKWFFALLFVILFMLSLTTVKIPFTVFAFLGGAVAIGVGFGMQALFKNLISGLMVLMERPFRLGDIVEVGNIRGKVVDINLRSSIIRNRDDIETLVPNSTFIEQQVTNWTYSSNRVRYKLNVGVAYGSSPKVVRDLLLETAQRHKLILHSPESEVFFEDFGSDALLFSLQYWLELSAAVDSQRVASDLRFMLNKVFTEAGVVFAFPQRDVHLDVGQPIPVKMVISE